MPELSILNSGLVDFQRALDQQLKWVAERKDEPLSDLLWLLSHPDVITLGASRTSRDNLLTDTKIPVIKISRGGDITYHDSGQLTGYCIFKLSEKERNLHQFLGWIEQAIINCLESFNIAAHRVDGKTGVFIAGKKICSIGIACRHWVTYHGFSINFSSNLKNYELIKPCGFSSDLMTNLEKISMSEFRQIIGQHLAKVTARDLVSVSNFESL